MSDILIQVEGLDKAQLQLLIDQTRPVQNQQALNEVAHFSGQDLIELALKLRDVDLDGLSLLVGYLLGRGHTLNIVFKGMDLKHLDMKTFRTLLEQLKELIKSTNR